MRAPGEDQSGRTSPRTMGGARETESLFHGETVIAVLEALARESTEGCSYTELDSEGFRKIARCAGRDFVAGRAVANAVRAGGSRGVVIKLLAELTRDVAARLVSGRLATRPIGSTDRVDAVEVLAILERAEAVVNDKRRGRREMRAAHALADRGPIGALVRFAIEGMNTDPLWKAHERDDAVEWLEQTVRGFVRAAYELGCGPQVADAIISAVARLRTAQRPAGR